METHYAFPANAMEHPFTGSDETDPATEGHRGSSPNHPVNHFSPHALRIVARGHDVETRTAGLNGDHGDLCAPFSKSSRPTRPRLLYEDFARATAAADTLVQMRAPEPTISPEVVRPRFTQGDAVHLASFNSNTNINWYDEASIGAQSALRTEIGDEVDDIDDDLEVARYASTPSSTYDSCDSTFTTPRRPYNAVTFPLPASSPPSPPATSSTLRAPSIGEPIFLDGASAAASDDGSLPNSPIEVLQQLDLEPVEPQLGSERDGDYELYDGDYLDAMADSEDEEFQAADETDDDFQEARRSAPNKGKGKQRQQRGLPFKTALWNTINDPKHKKVIHWSTDGTKGVIPDILKFQKSDAMKGITGATAFDSFKRQLNMWGFKRSNQSTDRTNSCLFWHEDALFQRGQVDLLAGITRKQEAKSRPKPAKKSTSVTNKKKGKPASKGKPAAKKTRKRTSDAALADISDVVNNDAKTPVAGTSSSQRSVAAPSSPTLGIAHNKKRRTTLLASRKRKSAPKAGPKTPDAPTVPVVALGPKTPDMTIPPVVLPSAPRKRRRTAP